ncbi:MAG: two-component regulator propeller domain-containing protein, partial [Bacteroidota bacterium]
MPVIKIAKSVGCSCLYAFCFFFYCNIFIPGKAFSQSGSFHHYTTSDGLSSSIVYNCLQDSKGYIWFSTDAGVCRFDGKRFEQFTSNNGLSDNEVFRIFQDHKKRIWFLTYNGHLSYYFEGKFYNEKNTPWLKKMFIGQSYTSVYEDKKDRLFFGTFGEAVVILNNQDVFIQKIKNGYGGANVYETEGDSIYISSADKRILFVENRFFDAPTKYHRCDVRYFNSSVGSFYYYSDSGLIKVNGSEEKICISSRLLPYYNAISSFAENNDSVIIVSTRGNGALFFPPSPDGVRQHYYQLLPDKIIHSVFIDKENNTWFNTEGDGVYVISDAEKNIKNYTLDDGLANVNINRIISGADGSIWLACGKQMITHILKDTIINYKLKTLIENRKDRVIDLAFDKENILWAGTDNGLAKIKPGFTSELVPMIFGDKKEYPSIKSISCSASGEIVISYFLGAAKRVVSKDHSDYLLSITDLEFRKRTYTLFIDLSNRIWIADINGLNLFKDEKLICYGDSSEELKGRIVQIREVDSTLVLVTSERGIIFFRNGKVIKQVTTADGLPSDICRKVYNYKNWLWVCTNRGLAGFRYADDRFSEVKVFDESNGLISSDVHDVFDDGKNLYIATDKGLTVLDKSITSKRSVPPPVYITKLLINGKPANFDSSLTKLSYKKNSLIISFIAITYQSPQKVFYQYKLNTNNSDWINTANNTIEFSSLPPDQYTFSLRAKKFNSDWSEPVLLKFTIHPPFWRTAWFITLLVLCGIGILALLQRYYSRIKLRKQLAEMTRRELLLNERSRISSDMHDDLGADLSRIVVLSEVMLVTEKLNSSTSSSLDKISRYAMDLRIKVDEIIWALNPRHDTFADLISYIHRYTLDYFDGSIVTCKLSLPEIIPDLQVSAAFRRNVFLILKESLHNVIKHASASNLEISISITGNLMEMKVNDNGKGFNNTEVIPHRNGIGNMQRRAKEIGGKFEISSE